MKIIQLHAEDKYLEWEPPGMYTWGSWNEEAYMLILSPAWEDRNWDKGQCPAWWTYVNSK